MKSNLVFCTDWALEWERLDKNKKIDTFREKIEHSFSDLNRTGSQSFFSEFIRKIIKDYEADLIDIAEDGCVFMLMLKANIELLNSWILLCKNQNLHDRLLAYVGDNKALDGLFAAGNSTIITWIMNKKPADILTNCLRGYVARYEDGIGKILASRCRAAIQCLLGDAFLVRRLHIFANTEGGLKKILASQSSSAIQSVIENRKDEMENVLLNFSRERSKWVEWINSVLASRSRTAIELLIKEKNAQGEGLLLAFVKEYKYKAVEGILASASSAAIRLLIQEQNTQKDNLLIDFVRKCKREKYKAVAKILASRYWPAIEPLLAEETRQGESLLLAFAKEYKNGVQRILSSRCPKAVRLLADNECGKKLLLSFAEQNIQGVEKILASQCPVAIGLLAEHKNTKGDNLLITFAQRQPHEGFHKICAARNKKVVKLLLDPSLSNHLGAFANTEQGRKKILASGCAPLLSWFYSHTTQEQHPLPISALKTADREASRDAQNDPFLERVQTRCNEIDSAEFGHVSPEEIDLLLENLQKEFELEEIDPEELAEAELLFNQVESVPPTDSRCVHINPILDELPQWDLKRAEMPYPQQNMLLIPPAERNASLPRLNSMTNAGFFSSPRKRTYSGVSQDDVRKNKIPLITLE